MNDVIRRRIIARLEELDLTANAAAIKAGLDRSTVRKLLNGTVNDLKDRNLRKLAATLQVPPDYLRDATYVWDRSAPPAQAAPDAPAALAIPIVGEVEEGSFRRLDWYMRADLGNLPTFDPHFPLAEQVAYVVRGGGMQQAGICEGDRVICLDPWRSGIDIGDGDYVVVEAFASGGDTRELTLKELVRAGDHWELVPRSSDPRYERIRLPPRANLRHGQPHVVGVVTSVIRHRPVRLMTQHVTGTNGSSGPADPPRRARKADEADAEPDRVLA